MLIHYVCKVCGRAIKSEIPPLCCYFDKCHSLENISDEDAIKMGLFSSTPGVEIDVGDQHVIFEFFYDARYDPFIGSRLYVVPPAPNGQSLAEFQNQIMQGVLSDE